ncbi:MAG TPA: DUF4124 domain-containing protein [Moraxellaceae bacterium]
MKTTASLAAFLGTLLLATSAQAAQFYKWTDEQGVTHYSADPPPKSVGNASSVKVKTRLPADSEAAVDNLEKQRADSKKADKAAPKKDDAAAPAAKPATERYADKCKNLQSDLKTMEEHARINVTDEKGEVRTLTEEEKQQRVDDTKRQVKAFCES